MAERRKQVNRQGRQGDRALRLIRLYWRTSLAIVGRLPNDPRVRQCQRGVELPSPVRSNCLGPIPAALRELRRGGL